MKLFYENEFEKEMVPPFNLQRDPIITQRYFKQFIIMENYYCQERKLKTNKK